MTLSTPARQRRLRLAGGIALAGAIWMTASTAVPLHAANTPRLRLSAQEFWKLSSDASEPNGDFRSDNLLSNELFLQAALPQLVDRVMPGRAYLGVGPEQNFTYIAALKPSIAFIVDIRRDNLDLHLLYKALFELSADRAEFVSRLFSRSRPAGVGPSTSAAALFDAYGTATGSDERYRGNLADIRRQLLTVDGLRIPEADLVTIEGALLKFHTEGPGIRYSPDRGTGGTIQPTYTQIMTATDSAGIARGFLANEELFRIVKDYEQRNLIVPVVGDFAGPKAIRAIARYLKSRKMLVSAFYTSNVEEYLTQSQIGSAFCLNLSSLPIDDSSILIRSVFAGAFNADTMAFKTQLVRIADEARNCVLPR